MSQETLPTVLEVLGHVWPLLPMIVLLSCSTYVTDVWLQQQLEYGIHPQAVRNRITQNFQPIHAYRPYFGQILTRPHRTARWDWCYYHLHFQCADWYLILFSDECRFNLSHADAREFIVVRESVLLMRASLSWTVSEVVQSWNEIMGDSLNRY